MGTIIFWLGVAFSVYWTIGWLLYRSYSRGHAAQIFTCLALWGVVLVFVKNPDYSRLHMLWAMPLAFYGVSPIQVLYFRLCRPRAYEI